MILFQFRDEKINNVHQQNFPQKYSKGSYYPSFKDNMIITNIMKPSFSSFVLFQFLRNALGLAFTVCLGHPKMG